jgi:hypothetical protein
MRKPVIRGEIEVECSFILAKSLFPCLPECVRGRHWGRGIQGEAVSNGLDDLFPFARFLILILVRRDFSVGEIIEALPAAD